MYQDEIKKGPKKSSLFTTLAIPRGRSLWPWTLCSELLANVPSVAAAILFRRLRRAVRAPRGKDKIPSYPSVSRAASALVPDRTVLSRPPVHSLVPSLEMSMQLAPSVWPWNCLRIDITIEKESHTAMFPSEQQEKQTLESGLMARA
ncbi:hypothetical protein EYF80_023235 [Liparis tanakae]|uniref:Uncharacterized protein n=1 Tax=Liparis tanakae TaxID=230148 RepID=A0A4Z2HKY5_9TELE|nr:hypothetical protein EYF80_023235 [Liparis tanakae]